MYDDEKCSGGLEEVYNTPRFRKLKLKLRLDPYLNGGTAQLIFTFSKSTIKTPDRCHVSWVLRNTLLKINL